MKADSNTNPDIHRGLIGVHFDRTDVSLVDGKKGTLSVRGYFVDALVAHSTFEETAYLLLSGELPDSNELERFQQELCAARQLPKQILSRRPGDVAATYCDPSKARRELDWSTRLTIDDACADYWNWQTRNPQGYATA